MNFVTFVWDELFCTGLQVVDSQHRHLVDLVNELSVHLVQGKGEEESFLGRAVEELSQYASHHFASEAQLMEECGIDPRHEQAHKLSHRLFVEQVTSIWETRRTRTSPSRSLLEFLISWLSFHILGEDQSMARQVIRIRAGDLAATAFETDAVPQDKITAALLRALHNLYHLLSEQIRDLAAANQHLEERVAQRTSQLEFANRQLELVSRTDGLLGIANRMYLEERLEEEWKRARREQEQLALLMIDVDFFKRYNDSYGHLQGDACLRAVARATLQALQRPGDLLARYGGEELVALLPRTGLAGAQQVAEAIRAELAALAIPHVASGVAQYVTVSIGAASIIPGLQSETDQLIAAADAALYEAKRLGRDRVVVHRHGPSDGAGAEQRAGEAERSQEGDRLNSGRG